MLTQNYKQNAMFSGFVTITWEERRKWKKWWLL